MEPYLTIEDGRIVYSYHIKENPINMDFWCDQPLSYKQNPRIIYQENQETLMATMDNF
jgi:hypothetical protein